MTEGRRADGQLVADLWVFRAVARSGGMSAAGIELNVTPGAVSQRVLRLEARIGMKLFERQKSRLALTAAGSLMLDAINNAALTLNNALTRLADSGRSSIVVSCGPSLTTEWLMPNLAEFYGEFPGIELLVRSETAQPSAAWMEQEGIDVLIHYCHQRLAGLVELASLQEWTFPVCSPAYLERMAELPREQRAVVLMHDDDAWRQGEPPHAEWQEWLEHAGSAWTFLTAGERHFNQAQLAYQAAVYGQGIAMARAVSVNALLKNNKLVRAVDAQPAPSASYRVVARCEHAADSPAARFASWLARALVATQRDTLRPFETSSREGL
jgi:DNA-binding transcriptional LysR family regulator